MDANTEPALTPEITDMASFKSWLEKEYKELTDRDNKLFRQNNPQMHNINQRRLELIKVGKAARIELVNKPSLEEE